MKTEAPFSEEQIQNINQWQESGFVPRLSCPNNCDTFGERLFAIEVGLFCPQCDQLVQEWVPTNIADRTKLNEAENTVKLLNMMRVR